MIHKSAFITARIDEGLKQSAEKVLGDLGITRTQAITMLYRYLEKNHAWPGTLKVPNETTRKALEESDQGIGLVECEDIDNLFKKLGL